MRCGMLYRPTDTYCVECKNVDSTLKLLFDNGHSVKSYLINLDHDSARLVHMRETFGRSGIEFERLAATNGSSLEDPGPVMTRGEVGCFLSHRRAWEKIAGDTDRYAAVFEDDIHIAPALAEYLSRIDWIPDDADIIKLETALRPVCADREGRPALGDNRLVRLRSTHYRTGGYIIKAETAAALCRSHQSPQCTVDLVLFAIDIGVASDLRIYQVEPALCIQDVRLKTRPRNPDLASNLFDERNLRTAHRRAFRRRLARLVRSARNRIHRRIDCARNGYSLRKIPFAGMDH
ncbi:MAG: glycosyltransferase family 25 protein [Alphaproteobacteria bacterium]